MARHLRVEYPGGFDHFTARDTDQQTMVHAETDRTDLLDAARAEDFPAALAQGHVKPGPRPCYESEAPSSFHITAL
jgi:hypothetical protein